MAHDMDESESCDVCVVGAGPVGMFTAVTLASAGVKVFAFDCLPQLSDDPRAIAHMPPLFPLYAKAGVLKQMQGTSSIVSTGISFRKVQDQKIIDKIQPPPGRPGPLTCSQKEFCEILLAKLREFPSATVEFGQNITTIEQVVDGFSVGIEDVSSQRTKFVKCKYLVGADGPKSVVRSFMGLDYQGETLPFKFMASNVVFPFEKYGFEGATYMMDPQHFGMIVQYAVNEQDESVWRVSSGFPISMSDQEIINSLPEKYSSMLPEMTPGSYRILKVKPYIPHQFCVPTMRKNSAFLIGDAAHLANPYSGQAMGCGIFDAASLAECLISVMRGEVPATLLDDWSEDRVAKFNKIMDPLSRACFAAVRDPDTDTIAQRHPYLKAFKAGPNGPPPPSLATHRTKLKSWPVGAETNGLGAEAATEKGPDKTEMPTNESPLPPSKKVLGHTRNSASVAATLVGRPDTPKTEKLSEPRDDPDRDNVSKNDFSKDEIANEDLPHDDHKVKSGWRRFLDKLSCFT